MNTEEQIKAKMNAGLTREQATEIVANQKEHDATHPHDPVPKKAKAHSEPEVPEDLNELTVPELKELAAKKGVDLHSDMVKSDIIDAIEKAD